MASGWLFIDGRDPDNVFTAGNAGITTKLEHQTSGSDLGSLYAAGNSGITTGLLSQTGADIGSLFATSTPSLPINGELFTSDPTQAGGISTALLIFNTNNASWSVTVAFTGASGSIPSGATKCKVTPTYVTGNTGTSITNALASMTTLSGTNESCQLHLTAPQSSPITATYSILIQYENSAGSIISSTTCTFFMDTSNV